MLRDMEVSEDGPHDGRVGEEREDAHLPVATRTPQGVDLVDTGEELGPATARAAVDPVGAWGVGYGAVEVGPGAGVEFVHVVTLVAGRFPPPLRVRGEDAVIAVAVDTRRRNQARETVEELEGRETDPGASVPSGPG